MAHRSGLRLRLTLFALLLGTAAPLSALAQDPLGSPLITRFETNKAPANPAQYEQGEEITVYFSVAQDADVFFMLTNPDGDVVIGDWWKAEANVLYTLDGIAIGPGEHRLSAIAQIGIPGVPGLGFGEVQDLFYVVPAPPETPA